MAAAVLEGGARDTPGSDAAGVGVAAGEAADSAVRVGSDNKESPISASTEEAFKGSTTPPQKRKKNGKKINNQNEKSKSN